MGGRMSSSPGAAKTDSDRTDLHELFTVTVVSGGMARRLQLARVSVQKKTKRGNTLIF
jgi:hypothetical protein